MVDDDSHFDLLSKSNVDCAMDNIPTSRVVEIPTEYFAGREHGKRRGCLCSRSCLL